MKKNSATAQDYFELGQFYLLNQKYSEAIKQFNLALRQKPDAVIYYYLGLAYEASNQIIKAKEMYRKAVTLDPKCQDAQVRLDRLSNK
ncbi:MAG: tetratricopeptide repeat protein, partial [candidate division WOR-3 bacterium]|nr:tetratricopeptide repeat protein [candidate division WOR-3 bacterium]